MAEDTYNFLAAVEQAKERNGIDKKTSPEVQPKAAVPETSENDTPEVGIPSKETSSHGRERPISKDPKDIDPKSFNNNVMPFQVLNDIIDLIERNGIPTKWERAYPCPCFNVQSNQPDPSCPLCQGRGLIYRDPKYLQVMFQSNEKGAYSGPYGLEDLGTTMATPQITENGIENGISFRDRLTIGGLTIAQSYMFNVTASRCEHGQFIPFLVAKFNKVFSMNKKTGLLLELQRTSNLAEVTQEKDGADYYFDEVTNKIYVSKKYLNRNITMNLTCPLRYYVVDIRKETRFAQVKNLKYKKYALGYGDPALKNYIETYKDALEPGIIYVRLPKFLVLRREDMLESSKDLTSDTGSEPNKELDPKLNVPPTTTETGSSTITDWLTGGG